MLDPKNIAGVDDATALGIAALWNDAIPALRQTLECQIADIDDGIRLAHECARSDCDTHGGVLHLDGHDDCPCWGCNNSGLFVMADDAGAWIDDINDGAPNLGPSDSVRLLGLLGDCLYVNERAPRTRVGAYKLGPVYRLLAELADQAAAYYNTLLAEDSATA